MSIENSYKKIYFFYSISTTLSGQYIFTSSWFPSSDIFDKGSQIGIEGRIETGNYDDKDGIKRYTTDVIVEDITFLDKKNAENQNNTQVQEPVQEDPYAAFGNTVEVNDNFLE